MNTTAVIFVVAIALAIVCLLLLAGPRKLAPP